MQIVKDFLYQCFQKDPNLRVSARKLLRHAWMQTVRKGGDESATVEAIQKVQAWNEALNGECNDVHCMKPCKLGD